MPSGADAAASTARSTTFSPLLPVVPAAWTMECTRLRLPVFQGVFNVGQHETFTFQKTPYWTQGVEFNLRHFSTIWCCGKLHFEILTSRRKNTLNFQGCSWEPYVCCKIWTDCKGFFYHGQVTSLNGVVKTSSVRAHYVSGFFLSSNHPPKLSSLELSLRGFSPVKPFSKRHHLSEA